MSQEQNLKDIIKQEWLNCANDPSHFMRKYCYIQNPVKGRILFNLYPFQAAVLKLWKENQFSIVLKSRQLGISTLAAGYALWLMLFHKDKNVLCLATKTDTAKNMVTKVKFMYDNLPSWLKGPKPEEDNKLSLKLANGSQIKAVSAASDSGRSEAVSLLLVDEAAFIEGIDHIWASSYPTLSTGGGAIVLSTPFGTGNWFHKTWVRAESGEIPEEGIPKFLPIKLPWNVHPERTQNWRKLQDEILGDPRLAAQECDCNFSTSGDTFFYSEIIDYIENNTVQDPIEKRGIDGNFWIWEYVDYSKNYLISADVSRGDGRDYSYAHVIDISENKQVAEYRGQLGTTEFAHLLMAIANEYNGALLIVENSNMGWATVKTIEEKGYSNLYYSPKGDTLDVSSYINKYYDTSNMVPGFTNSLKTRPLILSKFKEYLMNKPVDGKPSVLIRSKRLLEEMRVFIWRNGKPEAQQGYNDDGVISFSIGMFIRDTALVYKQQGTDLAKAALNNITSTKPNVAGGYGMNPYIQNPYQMKINGRNENFNWLL